MNQYRCKLEGCLDLFEPGDKIGRFIWGEWNIFTIKKLTSTAGDWHYYELEDWYTIGSQELSDGVHMPLSGSICIYRNEGE